MFDAGHSHLPAPGFVSDCPLCDAAKAARDQALAHFAEALLLLSQVPPVDPSEESTNTIRVNLAPIGLTGDDTGNCYSIDLTAKQAESLADAVDSMNAYLGSEQPIPFLPADTPVRREQVGSGEWSAAAVAQNDPRLFADVTDVFNAVDPQDLLDDVFASQDPHEALNAYEQLVTGEWDGGL
ncbi:hypothetical protein ACWGKO_16265 [Streptomyces griseoincarnatus]